MATSFPCIQKGNYCQFCKDYAECQKAQGLPYRKWVKANTVINIYPDGSVELVRYKNGFDYMYEAGNLPSVDRVRKMFKEGDYWVPIDGYDIASIQESIKNSSNRSKDTMYGYVQANEWEYFVTLTFSPEEVNRYDDEAVKYLWQLFRQKCQYHNPDCKILAVPERHEIEEEYVGVFYHGALHFHVLMSDIDLLFSPAINIKTGKPIYDRLDNPIFKVNSWDFGFSTASVMPKDNNYLRVANYLVKYITKSDNIGYNQKRYYHTHNLKFKNKMVVMTTEEDLESDEFGGLVKVKDNDKITVYRFSPGIGECI